MTFYESRVVLNFDPTWTVVHFDQTRFFKALAGQGLRGVDFLGIRGRTLYLIEIKNFSPVKRPKRYRHGARLNELVVQVQEKFSDSLRIIRVIHSTLRRHFLYRVWQSLGGYLPWIKALAPEDWLFWARCAELAAGNEVRPVLLLIDPHGRLGTTIFPSGWSVIIDNPPFSALPGMHISSEPDE